MAYASATTDEDLEKSILDRLNRDVRIDTTDITVESDAGRVTLSGSVTSGHARKIAQTHAEITPGTIAVDNRLKIKPRSDIPTPPDEEIRSDIENLLQWTSYVDASRIRVVVEYGIAILEGAVDAFWQRGMIEDRVSGIRGVSEVVNRLTVQPHHVLDDNAIARDVWAAIERNVKLDPDMISVIVKDGAVILSGTVADLNTYRVLENIAFHTKGVIDVENELVISPPLQKPGLNK